MGTIRELYTDAVVFENPFMAYGIFLLAQRNLIDWEADEHTLSLDPLSFEEINEAMKQNLLGLNVVNLYTLKTAWNTFAFILANDAKSATGEYIRVNKRKPEFTVEVNDRMDHSMHHEAKGKTMTFREIRNQIKKFPYYVCDYVKEETTYKEVEDEYFKRRRAEGFHETPFSERPLKTLEEL
jgi:hypothetical protein